MQVDGENFEQGNKYLNKLNKQNLEKDARGPLKADMFVEETSHSSRKKLDKSNCDCSNVNCIKCLKSQERNFNNNLSSNVNNNNILGSSNMLSVNRVNMRNKLRQQSSGHSSFEGSLSNSPCLSRGEYGTFCVRIDFLVLFHVYQSDNEFLFIFCVPFLYDH